MMNQQLSDDKAAVKEILAATRLLAEKYLDKQNELPPGRFINDIKLESLPRQGIGAKAALSYFESNFADKITNSAGPRYFGFVTGGSTPAALAGDWLVSAYDQNACGSNDSIAPQLERQTIHFFKEMFRLDPAYFGTFVTGATISNFTSLALARQWVGEQHNIDFSTEGLSSSKPIKIVSGTPHSSIIKSLSMLGLGRKSMIRIDTLPDREAIDIQALENYLREHQEPLIVVANAGTVNTVDFDDLEAIGKLKSTYKFWLHVDAAFGGFAACSEEFAHYMNGINYADSITIDAHKWLNVPYDAAMQFTRHQDLQLKVFQNSAAYLGDPGKSPDFFHYTPENSRRFRALPSWFTLMAYGSDGYREIVERNCRAARQLGNVIKCSENFLLLAPVRLNVVCFTLSHANVSADEIRAFLNAVRDDGRAFFTPTLYKGTNAIRAAVSNWLTDEDDIEMAFCALNDVHKALYNRKPDVTVLS
jgi:glutamate/tyrosine decarboxylase-like PLP-dependent enzyme